MIPAGTEKIRLILCDIEGTTSSISFVHQVMFPLSLKKMDAFLADHFSDGLLEPELTIFREKISIEKMTPEYSIQAAETSEVLKDLISRDVKDTFLKVVQGKIWKESFEDGSLRSHVYPDVPSAFSRWAASDRRIAIYSSGSVEAQKLFFAYTEAGDLGKLISGYFDTTSGPKKDSASYQTIARELGTEPSEILFLSDIPAELEAATNAGLKVSLVTRPGNQSVDGDAETRFHGIRSFDEIQ